jgi:hypothetical protein
MINIGIDWSETHHDICFLNDAGAVVTRVTVPHSPDGLLKLETTRQQFGVTANECRVGAVVWPAGQVALGVARSRANAALATAGSAASGSGETSSIPRATHAARLSPVP